LRRRRAGASDWRITKEISHLLVVNGHQVAVDNNSNVLLFGAKFFSQPTLD
jgi:hypothetical protein